jgi:signal peptidase I
MRGMAPAYLLPIIIAAPGLPALSSCGQPADMEEVKEFRVPSESMAPTLLPGDRFSARITRPSRLARGDVVLVDALGGGTFVMRIAGVPGDRIAMVGGVIRLNGRPIAQRLLATDPRGRRLAEQLPGEAAAHEIYDRGPTPGDDMPEQIVRPDNLFLLGDNRDNSNDSRFPARTHGLEQVAIDRVRGIPTVLTGSTDPARVGRAIR